MKDLLGRELKDGDLCIGMAIGRESNGMHLGILQGKSVVYLSYNGEYLHKSCTSNTYLIANPTEEELEVKDKIHKLMLREAEERKAKASMKTLPLKELEVGGVYKSNQGQYFLYLGNRKVTFGYKGSNSIEEKEGNCFASIGYFDESFTDSAILDKALYINTYRRTHNIDVLKGNKKLVEKVRQINEINFPLVKTDEWLRYDKLELKIE